MLLNKIRNIIAFAILFITVGMITNTPDWSNYEYFFNDDAKSKELMFYYSTYLIKMYGGDFRVLHIVFTSITSILFINFISKFTNKTILVILLYIPSVLVFYSTQIRFYLALAIILNSIYFFNIKKKYFIAFVLFVTAFFFHYSSVLFLPFYFLLNINITNFRTKKFIIYSILASIVFFTVINFALPSEFNTDYFVATFESSFLGSLYNFTPYIISFLFFLNVYKYNQVISLCREDNKMAFLYKMSFIPYLYLPIAFRYQIIGHRFIYIVLLFQILSIIYINKNLKRIIYLRLKNIFWLYIIFHIVFIYFSPYLFTINSSSFDNLILIFSSWIFR